MPYITSHLPVNCWLLSLNKLALTQCRENYKFVDQSAVLGVFIYPLLIIIYTPHY